MFVQKASLKVSLRKGLYLPRFYSKAASSTLVAKNDNNNNTLAPMNLIVLPITTKKKFIFYNYHKMFSWNTYLELQAKDLTTKSTNEQLKIKLQLNLIKMFNKALSIWDGMGKSDNRLMKYSFDTVQKLLSKINWFETCLSSIPSKNEILREMRLDLKQKGEFSQEVTEKIMKTNSDRHEFLNLEPIEKQTINNKTIAHETDFDVDKDIYKQLLKPIPLYYPKLLMTKSEIESFLSTEIQDKYYKQHMKSMIYCAIGLPLTIPFIALPVVPNVPGFYLCYRIYCHMKVVNGLKHLKYLVEDPLEYKYEGDIQGHLDFQNLDSISEIYLKHGKDSLIKSSNSEKEKLLINEEIVEEIIQINGLINLSSALHNCLTQEKKRLENI